MKLIAMPPDGVFSCNEIIMNVITDMVVVGGRPVHLTMYELRLLRFFLFHQDRVYTREELMKSLFVMDSLYPRKIDVLVSKVRRKIKPLDIIETVHGRGWRTRSEAFTAAIQQMAPGLSAGSRSW